MPIRTVIFLTLLSLVSAASADYTIVTAAGNGTEGYGGDGGDARCAQLNRPTGVDIDARGFILIADYSNHRVRRVAADGTITTVAGTGVRGFSGDGGPATAAQLAGPYAVRATDDGFLIADAVNGRIRHVDSQGIIRTIAGGDGQLQHPVDVIAGPDGALYVAEGGGNRVRRISGGVIETFAGSGKRRYNGRAWLGGDGGPARDAVLNVPAALAFDGDGNLFIADLQNHAVRRVGRDGVITTVAGTGRPGELEQPGGLAFEADGSLLISDLTKIRRLSKDGRLIVVAGDKRGFSGDHGPAASAQFAVLDLMAIDKAGNVYVADHRNSRIRKLVPAAASPASAPVRGPAAAGVEALLAKMRAAYQAIPAADIRFAVQRHHQPVKGSLRYERPAKIEGTLDVDGYGTVKIESDAETIRVTDPVLPDTETLPWSLQNARNAVAANLEVISIWDSQRQLNTGEGGNMRGEGLTIGEPETWRGRKWVVLEERAGDTLYRYFIDPKTSLIWRTLTTDSGRVVYDGTVEALRIHKNMDR